MIAHPAPADLALSQLRLGQLKVATTSNFAPWHRIEEMQERIVCEARFKPSSLDLQHENVEMFVRHVLPMFSASIGQQEKTMQLRPRRNSDKTLLQRLWPCIVFHIDIDECVAVLSGPDQPSTLPSQWTNTHQFRLRTPTISISAESNYHFLSVPLTDSRIREAQEAEERQKRKSEKRERSQTNDASRYRTSAVASNAALLFTSDTAAHSSFLDRSDRFPSHTSNTVYSAVYHTSISIASTHAIEISLQSASEGSQTGTSTFETTPVDRPSSPQDQWSFEDSALDPVSTRMFVLGPFDASSTFTFPLLDDGRSYSLQLDSKTGSVDVSFGRVELALWQHPMLSFLEDVSALMAEVTLPAKPSGDGGRPHTVHDSFSSLSVHCFAEAISLEVCGQDPSRDPDISRGLALVVRDIVCNAFTDRDWSASKIGDQARDRLHLQPQLPQSSGKNLDVTPHAALMIVDVDFQRFTLSPIIDAAKAASLGSTLEEEVMAMPAFVSHKEFMKVPRKEHLVPEDWEHTGRYSFASSQSSPLSSEQCINEADERVLTVAASSIRVIRQHHPVPSTSHSLGPNALASTHVQVQGSVLAFSFKLFHVYSCLVSASAIKRIYAVYRQHSSGKNA